MRSRRCGYCRSGNHRADKCEVKANQIEAVRRHFYHERVALHRLMVENGLGVGAIVQTNDGQVCVVRSLADSFGSWNNAFIEYRNIRYQKSVRSNLRSFSGINHSRHLHLDDMLVKFDHYSHFYLVVNPLSDLSRDNYGVACLSQLPHPPPDNRYVLGQHILDGYYREKHIKILSPSNETDVDENKLFNVKMRLHERLGKDKDGYGLVVDPIITVAP